MLNSSTIERPQKHYPRMFRKISRIKKGLILSFTCAMLFLIFVLSRGGINPLLVERNGDLSCFEEDSNGRGFPDLPENYEHEISPSGKNIFFHETSCFNKNGIVLSARQACAVESAAKNNPGRGVHLFFISPERIANRSKKFVQQLLSYPNVKIRRIKPGNYVKDTPLEDWFMTGTYKASYWPHSHMSDILRYLTLWKYPGVYLDLDTVVLKSFDTLESDFAGTADLVLAESAIIGLSDSVLGRKLAFDCINDLKTNFDGYEWINNGPGVITRVLQEICSTSNNFFTRIFQNHDVKPGQCRGFTIYDPSILYPILYQLWKQFFEEKNNNLTMKILQNASVIHLWNKLSKSEPVRVSSNVPYAVIARTHCPKVFENCGDIF